jgi:hypothetical protein
MQCYSENVSNLYRHFNFNNEAEGSSQFRAILQLLRQAHP